MDTVHYIYKILPYDVGEKAAKSTNLPTLPIDEKDGFVHFSTLPQLVTTLNKHFSGHTRLVLVEVRVAALSPELRARLKWEKNHPEGDAYPHLYAQLPVAYVKKIYHIKLTPEGEFDIPDLSR